MPSELQQHLDDPWLALILTMIWEYQQGSDSLWHSYFDVLPSTFDTLMFWSDEELASLQGSAVLSKIGKSNAEQTFEDKIIPLINAHKDTFKASQLDAKQLLALCHRMGSTIMAYAFDIESADQDDGKSDDNDSWAEDDGAGDVLPVGMIPLADMLNANGDKNNAKLYYEADNVVMRSIKSIREGEEIFNDYGALPRADLLRRYGYITDEYAEYDVVEIPQDLVIDNAVSSLHASADEMRDRLAYLDVLDIQVDAFELTREAQQDGRYAPELVAAVNILSLSNTDYKTLRAKASRPSTSQLTETSKQLMRSILTTRRAQYSNDVSMSLDATSRRQMAAQIIAGEIHILDQALKRFLPSSSTNGKRPAGYDGKEHASHKKRRA